MHCRATAISDNKAHITQKLLMQQQPKGQVQMGSHLPVVCEVKDRQTGREVKIQSSTASVTQNTFQCRQYQQPQQERQQAAVTWNQLHPVLQNDFKSRVFPSLNVIAKITNFTSNILHRMVFKSNGERDLTHLQPNERRTTYTTGQDVAVPFSTEIKETMKRNIEKWIHDLDKSRVLMGKFVKIK
jgi:hypothetical protein